MRIEITTDCVCDLPQSYIDAYGIGVMNFYITTSGGRFRDGEEITSENIIDYFERGGYKAAVEAPAPEEYAQFFQSRFNEECEEIIHITGSKRSSRAYQNAAAAARMVDAPGQTVHIMDTDSYSGGLGYFVLKAAKMRDNDATAKQILDTIYAEKEFLSTSFILPDAEVMSRSFKAGKRIRGMCNFFGLHPTFTFKDGKLKVKNFMLGSYKRSMVRYIRGELGKASSINRDMLVLTYAGCDFATVSAMKKELEKYGTFGEIITARACASVSANCGSGMFGVMFMQTHKGSRGGR